MSSWCLLLFPETAVVRYADARERSGLHRKAFVMGSLTASRTRHHMLTTAHYGKHTVLCPNHKRLDAGRKMTAPAQIYGLRCGGEMKRCASERKGA